VHLSRGVIEIKKKKKDFQKAAEKKAFRIKKRGVVTSPGGGPKTVLILVCLSRTGKAFVQGVLRGESTDKRGGSRNLSCLHRLFCLELLSYCILRSIILLTKGGKGQESIYVVGSH